MMNDVGIQVHSLTHRQRPEYIRSIINFEYLIITYRDVVIS